MEFIGCSLRLHPPSVIYVALGRRCRTMPHEPLEDVRQQMIHVSVRKAKTETVGSPWKIDPSIHCQRLEVRPKPGHRIRPRENERVESENCP